MKKITLSVLLSCLLVGLVACTNDNTDNKATTNNAQTENDANNQSEEREKIDFDIENEANTEDIKESDEKDLNSEVKQVVIALVTGDIEGDFYDKFNEDIVSIIKDAVQDGSEDEVSDEELTEKFLNNYVQLSDKVKEFIDANGDIREVVINKVDQADIEHEDEKQKTMEIDTTVVAENEEELPLEILFDVTKGDYEYINIASPRT